ncbi:hypothetical protein Tco_0815357 [Tanacetum coccineum]
MKEIEFLRKENSILKKEDNPKRKAIASECKSEESSDKPIPIIKTQDIVKKTYEISHCSPTKEDMFKTHMFVSNRGRGGVRGRGSYFGRNTNFIRDTPNFKQNDFPSLIDKSFKESLFEKKQDYNYHCKMYLNNFLKLANKLNNEPQKIINEYEGYSTFAHEKVNQLVGLFNCDPNLIKATYDYGLLHSVYTKDGSELCKIPEVYEQAKYYLKITKATMIYVRFYGAVGEVTFEEIIHTTRLVKMGLTRDFMLIEYDTDGPKVLEKIYWKILSPEDMDTKVFAKNYLSEKGFEYLCKNLYFEESHKCRYCGKGETGVPELFNFEDIPEEASTSQNDESNDETI